MDKRRTTDTSKPVFVSQNVLHKPLRIVRRNRRCHRRRRRRHHHHHNHHNYAVLDNRIRLN